jgi:hypothetical protein
MHLLSKLQNTHNGIWAFLLVTTLTGLGIGCKPKPTENGGQVSLRQASGAGAIERNLDIDSTTQTSGDTLLYTIATEVSKGKGYSYEAVYPIMGEGTNQELQKAVIQTCRLVFGNKTPKEDAVAFGEMARQTPASPAEYERHIAISVKQNGRVLTLLTYGWDFTGGAHPNSYQHATLLDIESGKRLTEKDIFPANAEHEKRFIEAFYVRHKIPAGTPLSAYKGKYQFLPEVDTPTLNEFYIEQDTLTGFYNPYEIGPYSEGFFWAKAYVGDLLLPPYRARREAAMNP